MKFVWTKSTILGGKQDLITWALEEPCSHFAIEFNDGRVFHSSLHGVKVIKNEKFYHGRALVYNIDFNLKYETQEKIEDILEQYVGDAYDWLFFFWLVWVAIKRKIFRIHLPDTIGRQQKGGILCTEAINLIPDIYRPNIDLSRVTTPYRLYKILKGVNDVS